MSEYGPSLTALKLYKRTSQKGTTYFTGRMGRLKVALLKSNETTDDGFEIWNLVYQQADEKPRQDNKPTREERARANEPLGSPPKSCRPMSNDAIPF
jgi:hypothetical protein